MADALFDPFSLEDPAAAERVLSAARTGDAVSCPYPGVYVITDDAGVRDVLADPQLFSNAYNFELERGPAPDAPDPLKVITRSDGAAHLAIEESLRGDSPLRYTMRTAAAETRLEECPVASRDRIVLSLQSANWDEKVWGAAPSTSTWTGRTPRPTSRSPRGSTRASGPR